MDTFHAVQVAIVKTYPKNHKSNFDGIHFLGRQLFKIYQLIENSFYKKICVKVKNSPLSKQSLLQSNPSLCRKIFHCHPYCQIRGNQSLSVKSKGSNYVAFCVFSPNYFSKMSHPILGFEYAHCSFLRIQSHSFKKSLT